MDSTAPPRRDKRYDLTIRELFRSSAEIEAEPSSLRAKRVLEVARAYRRRLREWSLVDPAETLWEAMRSSPSRRPVLVWGYPRLGRDELAFLDAIAGNDSVLYLPWAEDRLFSENTEAARELEEKGWSVEERPIEAIWDTKVSLEAHAYPFTRRRRSEAYSPRLRSYSWRMYRRMT